MERSGNFYKAIRLGYILISILEPNNITYLFDYQIIHSIIFVI